MPVTRQNIQSHTEYCVYKSLYPFAEHGRIEMLQELVEQEIVQRLMADDFLVFRGYFESEHAHLVRYLQCFGKGFFLPRDSPETQPGGEYKNKKTLLAEHYDQSPVVPIKLFQDALRSNMA